jgi:hypothetical protein
VTRDFSLRINEPLILSTSSLPQALEGSPFEFTLTATGGVPPYTWSASSLPSWLSLDASSGRLSGTPTQPSYSNPYIGVRDSSNPPQQDSRWFQLTVIGRLRILTSFLPAATVGTPLRVSAAKTGGVPPFSWGLASGALPAGLTLDPATGQISGTPSNAETQTFTIRLTDSGTTFPQAVEQTLTLSVVSSLGRNDSTAAATALSNGTYRASISPYAEPVASANPDNDYYAVTANAGAVVMVEITADRLAPPSPLDSVIEIVDAGGTRLTACSYAGSTGPPYDQSCLNDDISSGYVVDSKLALQVPGTPGTQVTFYVRVLDWRGDARPDLIYDITISGAN